jgi:hypothetical protein
MHPSAVSLPLMLDDEEVLFISELDEIVLLLPELDKGVALLPVLDVGVPLLSVFDEDTLLLSVPEEDMLLLSVLDEGNPLEEVESVMSVSGDKSEVMSSAELELSSPQAINAVNIMAMDAV